MREIKFRAWDIKNRLMYCVQRIDFDYSDERNMRVFVLGEFGKLMAQIVMGHFQSSDDYILMQYTDLKDNTKWEDLTEAEREAWTRAGNLPSQWDGKEIYEGDIVRVEDCRGYWEVYWEDDRWYLRREGDQYDNGDYYRGDDIDWEGVEIIGNIYENPELLND